MIDPMTKHVLQVNWEESYAMLYDKVARMLVEQEHGCGSKAIYLIEWDRLRRSMPDPYME